MRLILRPEGLLADVDPEVGGATVDELAKEFGGNILFAKADVTKRSEVADAIAACRKAFGGINVMSNNFVCLLINANMWSILEAFRLVGPTLSRSYIS